MVTFRKEKLTKAEEVRLLHQLLRKVPKKVYCEISGRQAKVVNEQGERYNLPIPGRTVDLAALIRRIHDFLAENSRILSPNFKRPAEPDRDDPLLSPSPGEPASPALERYRAAKADLAEQKRDEGKGKLIDASRMRDAHAVVARHLREAGETLRKQFGEEAAIIVEDVLDTALLEVEAVLGAGGADDDNEPECEAEDES